MDDAKKPFCERLEKLVAGIEKLNQQLVDDNHHFSINNLQKINESNEIKNHLLIELNANVQALQGLIPDKADGNKPSLSEYLKEFDLASAEKVKSIMNSLYSTLSVGYQHLVTNNHVVVENLGFINHFWDSIAKIAKQSDGVYSKPELK